MKFQAEAYQFVSRAELANKTLGARRASPSQRPDVVYDLAMEIMDKPFEVNFAAPQPTRPSSGAYQYVDNEIDVYMSKRWPRCLALRGIITLQDEEPTQVLLAHLAAFLRKLLWTPCSREYSETLGPDQRAAVEGYRREYFDRQVFDFDGNRRPNTHAKYVPTEVGEPAGPGVVSLPDIDASQNINEFVWSQILPFPGRTEFSADDEKIRRKVASLKKHYNSYNELRDAQRHVQNGETKAAVRSAASAVDAIIRFYGDLWEVKQPPKHLPFDEKIEHMLRIAGRPSYRATEAANLTMLLHLYRCRNSMHEGDCYYEIGPDDRVSVRSVSQVNPFLNAVEGFVLWIDALA